jgi:hypothetical protein
MQAKLWQITDCSRAEAFKRGIFHGEKAVCHKQGRFHPLAYALSFRLAGSAGLMAGLGLVNLMT